MKDPPSRQPLLARNVWTTYPGGSTNSRQLLPRQHRDHPLTADQRTHHHHPRVFRDNLADDGGILPQRMSTHHREESLGIGWRNHRQEFAFVGNIENIEA